jgi:hypothetical protein
VLEGGHDLTVERRLVERADALVDVGGDELVRTTAVAALVRAVEVAGPPEEGLLAKPV